MLAVNVLLVVCLVADFCFVVFIGLVVLRFVCGYFLVWFRGDVWCDLLVMWVVVECVVGLRVWFWVLWRLGGLFGCFVVLWFSLRLFG